MAGRAIAMLAMLALLLATAAAQAQTSEFEALPEPPEPAAAETAPLAPGQSKALPDQKQKAAAGKEKAAPAAALGAKTEPKQKDDNSPLGRAMAPTAVIPPFPGDEKGPKTMEFLGSCAGKYDRCMDLVREVGEKLSDSELCVPADIYFSTVTERVRKWATLRPDVQNLPAGRVIAAALRSIYPCKHGARTTAEKNAAPKAAKTAQ